MNVLQIHNGNEIILYALNNNCSREVYDLLVEGFNIAVQVLYLCYFKNLYSDFLAST
jgi:hypothetical protein